MHIAVVHYWDVYIPTHALFMKSNSHEWSVASRCTRDVSGIAKPGTSMGYFARPGISMGYFLHDGIAPWQTGACWHAHFTSVPQCMLI